MRTPLTTLPTTPQAAQLKEIRLQEISLRTTHFRAHPPFPNQLPTGMPAPQLSSPPPTGDPRESVRHILLGSSGAVRQTIHLLHTLHYTETVLWSPILAIEEPLVITPAPGETISLLRKRV